MRCAILSCVTMALSVTLACAHDMNALGLGNLDGTISNDVDGNLVSKVQYRNSYSASYNAWSWMI